MHDHFQQDHFHRLWSLARMESIRRTVQRSHFKFLGSIGYSTVRQDQKRGAKALKVFDVVLRHQCATACPAYTRLRCGRRFVC